MKNTQRNLFCILHFLYWTHIWLLTIYYPSYAKTLNFTDIQIGSIMSSYTLVSLICMVPFGILTDKFGTKLITFIGLVFLVIWTLIIIITKTFFWNYIAYLLGGIGIVLFLVSINSAFYMGFSSTNLKRNITYFITASTLGFMAGPYIGSYISERYNYIAAFKGDLVILSIMFVIMFFIKWPLKVKFDFLNYIKDLKKKKYIMVVLLTMVYYSHYGTEQTSYTLLMQNNASMTNIEIGNLFLYLGIWITLITLITGKISEVKYLVILYSLGIFVSGSFQALSGSANSYGSMIVLRVFHTMGDAICTLILGLLAGLIFSKKRLGFSFGFFLMAQLLAAIPFSYISGFLSKNNDYSVPFYFNGLFMVFVSIIILIFLKKIRFILFEKN